MAHWFASPQNVVTTGYIESTTAGRGVMLVTTDQALNYTGTGSTLVGQAGATGATILNITAPSVTIHTGTITSLGAGSTALSVTANGGAGSGGINATVDGNISSIGPGIVLSSTNALGDQALLLTQNAGTTVQAGGTAIAVNTAGTGAVTVNSSGTITSTAGQGVATGATTGATTITLGGAVTSGTEAVRADATTGAITVNINANATSTGAGDVIATQNDGVSIVNVQAGRTVNGAGGDVINFYGNGANATLNNSGTIGSATSNHAVFTGINKGVTVNNLTGGVINGNYDLSDLVDTINNSGTLNVRNVNNFYAGADAINNLSGGVFNTATGTSFDSLETISNAGTLNTTGTLAFTTVATALTNSGTINLGAGSAVTGLGATTSSGTINAGAGSSLSGGAFTNSGTLHTLGAFTLTSTGAFANSGTMNLAPALFTLTSTGFTNSGTINATGGATTITANQTLTNSGTINLADGATGDVLTITNGFTGTGASLLRIDAGGAAADRLVIGGAVGGATLVSVNGVGTIITTPILVVDTNGAASSAFTLSSTVANPLINLNLAQVGQDFFLTALPSISAIEPVVIGDMAPNLWYQSADIYSNYSALRRTDLGVNRTSNIGFWGEGYYSRDKSDDQDVSAFGLDFTVGRVTTKRWGFQAGVDYLLGNSFVLGVTGGWEDAKADVRNSVSDFKAPGWNAGAYGIFGGASGFYGDLLVKYDQAKLKFEGPALVGVTGSPKIKSWGALGQAGYRFGSMNGINFDLGAGLGYVRSKIDDFASGGIDFDFERVKSLRGDLAARVNFGTGPFTPFIEAKLFHEFEKHRNLRLVSGTAVDTIEGEGRGTWGRIEAGLGGQNSSGPILAAWVDVGDVTGVGAKAGWRFGGSPVAVAPPPPAPPPPPPPPPPPATQTCPDGSVILATDTCPAPPPPPPPPAPAPERGR